MVRKAKEKEVKDVVEEKNVDTKKVIKEINKQLEEKQNEILENLNEKINNQIEINVAKRMREEEKKIARGKFGKIIRRDIVILLLLGLVGYFGYCLYKVDYFHIRTKVVEVPVNSEKNNNEQKTPNENQNIPVKNEHDSAYLMKNYGYLVDNLQVEDPNIFELYRKEITNETISNNLKLLIAYKNLEEDVKVIEDNMIRFKISDLLESAKKIFGENTTLEEVLFTYNNTRFMPYNDMYLGYLEEVSKNNFLYQMIDAKEEEDKIVFEVIIAKLEDKKLLNSEDIVVTEDYKEEDLRNYQDKLTHYKITFEKEKENYIFSKLENK